MDDWRKEFQYLLDRKILSRDELGYLFGQIKSIIDIELNNHITKLKALLKIAKCPDCDGVQCQWCDEVKLLLKGKENGS